jgi:hypothetical protein
MADKTIQQFTPEITAVLGTDTVLLQRTGGGDYGFATVSNMVLDKLAEADPVTIGAELIIDDGVGRVTIDSVSGANRLLSTTTGFGGYEDMNYRADSHAFQNGAGSNVAVIGAGGGTSVILAGSLSLTGGTQEIYIGTSGASPSSSQKGWAVENNSGVGQYINSATSITGSFSHTNYVNPNGVVGSIVTNGSATSYNTSSDPDLKSEFVQIDDELAASMVCEAVESKWVGVFEFKAQPGVPVAGYNAWALVDNQPLFGGSEREGPRDAELGSVYEEAVYEQETDEDGNLLFDDIMETRERQKIFKRYDPQGHKTELKKFPAYFDDKGVFQEEAEKEVRYFEIPATYPDGSPFIEYYQAKVGSKPRMKLVAPEKRVTPASVDQSKRVPLLEAALYNVLKRLKAAGL